MAFGKVIRSPQFLQAEMLGRLTRAQFWPHSTAMDIQTEITNHGTDRYTIVCTALFLEAVVGRMSLLFRMVPHPNELLGCVAGFLGNRLDRSRRGSRVLVARGAIVVLFLGSLALFIGLIIERWTAGVPFAWMLELILLTLLISQRGTYGDASRTVRALTREGMGVARKCAAEFHRGEAYRLDSHGICRALTEHLAGSFGRHLVGPVFWYVVLGPPGMLIYSTVLATSHRLSRREESRDSFGWLAERMERVLAWVPGWIAGQIIVVASVFTPTARPVAAFSLMYSSAFQISPPTFGWPVTAFAGALSCELGGPNSVEGRRLTWFGDGSPRLTERDAHRALMLFGYGCVVHAALALGLALVGFSIRD